MGKSLAESRIRERTECSVVALEHEGSVSVDPPPDLALPAGAELILIGTTEGEQRFVQLFEKVVA